MAMIDTLKPAFEQLGVELKHNEPMCYDFEYEYLPVTLVVDEDNPGNPEYFLTERVHDPLNGAMDEYIFTTAMEVVKELHPAYTGDWNDGSPFVMSEFYQMGHEPVPTQVLRQQLDDFVEFYCFLEVNIFLVHETKDIK